MRELYSPTWITLAAPKMRMPQTHRWPQASSCLLTAHAVASDWSRVEMALGAERVGDARSPPLSGDPLESQCILFWQETFSSPSLLWVRPCPNFPDQNCLKHLPKHRSAGLPLRPPGLEPHNQENCPSGTGVPWNADTQPMPQKVETRPVYVMFTEALGETTEQRRRPWRGQGVCRDAVWQPPLQWQVEGVREKGALIQFFLQWTVSKFFCARYVCVPRWDFVMIIFLC